MDIFKVSNISDDDLSVLHEKVKKKKIKKKF